MSASLTVLGRQWVLRAAFRQEATFIDLPLKCALTRVVADVESDPAELDEPNLAVNYVRVNVPVGTSWLWDAGTRTIQHNAAIVFDDPTGPWGLITGWALTTDDGSGLVAVGSLVNPRRIEAGVRAQILAGELRFGLTD